MSTTRFDLVEACEVRIWRSILHGVSVDGAPAPRLEIKRHLNNLLIADDLLRHQDAGNPMTALVYNASRKWRKK